MINNIIHPTSTMTYEINRLLQRVARAIRQALLATPLQYQAATAQAGAAADTSALFRFTDASSGGCLLRVLRLLTAADAEGAHLERRRRRNADAVAQHDGESVEDSDWEPPFRAFEGK